jgi:hypothetical protein
MITLPRPTREVVPRPTHEVVPRQMSKNVAASRSIWVTEPGKLPCILRRLSCRRAFAALNSAALGTCTGGGSIKMRLCTRSGTADASCKAIAPLKESPTT